MPSWTRPRELARLATSRLKPYPALAFSSAGGLTVVSGHRHSADCVEIWLSDLADALSLQSQGACPPSGTTEAVLAGPAHASTTPTALCNPVCNPHPVCGGQNPDEDNT